MGACGGVSAALTLGKLIWGSHSRLQAILSISICPRQKSVAAARHVLETNCAGKSWAPQPEIQLKSNKAGQNKTNQKKAEIDLSSPARLRQSFWQRYPFPILSVKNNAHSPKELTAGSRASRGPQRGKKQSRPFSQLFPIFGLKEGATVRLRGSLQPDRSLPLLLAFVQSNRSAWW